MFTAKHAMLALGMLITGSFNTIMTTWQDKTHAPNRYGEVTEYQHPWFQTFTMFIGELLCLVAFHIVTFTEKRKRKREGLADDTPPSDFPLWVFALPTVCDLTASTIMNIGLIFTTASVYQMIRGAMVLFTALFSVLFLKRRLYIQHYAGLMLVVMGIVIVGLSSVLYNSKGSAKNPALGNSLVLGAQLIVATQFVVEEKFLGKYNVAAMQAVGLEGLAGVTILLCVLPCMQFITYNGKPIEDTYDAVYQIAHSTPLLIGNLGSIFSIAFFNFFGVSVTKQLSSVHRTTIDSCRTVLIWVISMCLGWEKFVALQLCGFVVLGSGTFIYNEVIALPFMPLWRRIFPASLFKEKLAHEIKPLLSAGQREAAGATVSTPPPTPRSPMDLRLRYYTRLALPAARTELPDFVTEELTHFRHGILIR